MSLTTFPGEPQKRMGAPPSGFGSWRGLEKTLGGGIDNTWAIGQQVFDGRDERFLRRARIIFPLVGAQIICYERISPKLDAAWHNQLILHDVVILRIF
jgi:hypothetical protein